MSMSCGSCHRGMAHPQVVDGGKLQWGGPPGGAWAPQLQNIHVMKCYRGSWTGLDPLV